MNGTLADVDMINGTSTPMDFQTQPEANDVFRRHEFLRQNPWTSIPIIIVLSLASLGGTFGNVLTLITVALCKEVRNVESIFIVNLALSDLCVTAVANPMSILAKLEGEEFFDSIPRLCKSVGELCTISCTTSLMTIAMLSLNRYVFVCRRSYYEKIFSKRNCIIICTSLYSVGIGLVLLNLAGIGDHSFDRKSIQCIWDRMATYYYTVIFSVTLVWIPFLMIGLCYLRLYRFVHNHKKRMRDYIKAGTSTPTEQSAKPNLQLHVAKSIFVIYAVFVLCWTPYALILVVDSKDAFSHEAHVYITTFAHLHPSVNWLIYFTTQKKFASAYRQVLTGKCGKKPVSNLERIAKKASRIQRNALCLTDTKGEINESNGFDNLPIHTRQNAESIP